MPQVPWYVYPIASAIVFFLLGWFVFKFRYVRKHGQAELTCDRIIQDARKEAGDIIKSAELEAKEEFFKARQQFEKETESGRREARLRQESLDKRENNLDKKVAFIDNKENRLDKADEEMRQTAAGGPEARGGAG
jgi:ribonuclease Y